MDNNQDIKAYKKAEKRVKNEKDFYNHLTAYIVINISILIFQQKILELIHPDIKNEDFLYWYWFSYIVTVVFWGIGLFFHGLWAFKKFFLFNKKWEESKVKEYMNQEGY